MKAALRDYLEAQLLWTTEARGFIYRKIGLANLNSVLEVGCGSGTVAMEVASRIRGSVTAIDMDAEAIEEARRSAGPVRFVAGDFMNAGFAAESFDAVFCHFFVMWQKDAAAAIREMARVARKGGFVAAMAEPDYGGLVQHPEIPRYREFLITSLEAEGADPFAGGKLLALFHQAGLQTDCGILSQPWTAKRMIESFEKRWGMLSSLEAAGFDVQEIMLQEKQALDRGDYLFFLPVFWAIGRNR